MTDDSCRKALEDLKIERERLLSERQQLERRLSVVEATILNLTVIVEGETAFDGSLADACRHVLKSAPGRIMLPTEVRDEIKQLGYSDSKHTNLMASIHAVLKRLAEGSDVDTRKLSEGTGYWWAKGITDPARVFHTTMSGLKRSIASGDQDDPTLNELAKAIRSEDDVDVFVDGKRKLKKRKNED